MSRCPDYVKESGVGRGERRTPKIGPAVKVESAPDSEEEQTNEQKDEAAA